MFNSFLVISKSETLDVIKKSGTKVSTSWNWKHFESCQQEEVKILNEKDFLFFVQCLDIGEAWEEAEVDQGQASSFQANCSKSIPRPKGIQTYSKTIQKIFQYCYKKIQDYFTNIL